MSRDKVYNIKNGKRAEKLSGVWRGTSLGSAVKLYRTFELISLEFGQKATAQGEIMQQSFENHEFLLRYKQAKIAALSRRGFLVEFTRQAVDHVKLKTETGHTLGCPIPHRFLRDPGDSSGLGDVIVPRSIVDDTAVFHCHGRKMPIFYGGVKAKLLGQEAGFL